MIKIYTDGSCLENPGNGGWAAIIIDEGKKTGAIINNDSAGYEQYVRSLHHRELQKKEIDQMKSDIGEIKEALKQLTKKLV